MTITTGMDMGLRLELFVSGMDASIDFYRGVLGFELMRRESDYASLRSGGVTVGLGPIAKLPLEDGYVTRSRLAEDRGAGVEIVFEVDDIAAYRDRVGASGHPLLDDLQLRPWGLTDFRIADPDGYYLRITSRD
ncbi:MAG: VOC family protein [Chloroflexia bacterium]|nr:VOC family protein [Chloroflexia bacterium]